jgi:molybdate transport system substrate-binding protein
VRAALIRRGLAVIVTSGLLALAGCGGGSGGGSGDTGTAAGPQAGSSTGVTGDLTVFAAASLTETFNQIGKDFEATNPGVKVTFDYASSSALATQIYQGAPADVFASAAPKNMQTVTDAGNADGTPVTFVKNQLVIAVAKGNPKSITGLADLTKPGVKVAECAAQVPCGAAATKALAAANVKLTPVTLEQNVKSALAKVKLGEVDAALVYRTDAKAAASAVDDVEFPESVQAINDYPIVVLKGSINKPAAQAFVTYVTSAKGMAVLTAAGFQAP